MGEIQSEQRRHAGHVGYCRDQYTCQSISKACEKFSACKVSRECLKNLRKPGRCDKMRRNLEEIRVLQAHEAIAACARVASLPVCSPSFWRNSVGGDSRVYGCIQGSTMSTTMFLNHPVKKLFSIRF